jgi:hypothetical protein
MYPTMYFLFSIVLVLEIIYVPSNVSSFQHCISSRDYLCTQLFLLKVIFTESN